MGAILSRPTEPRFLIGPGNTGWRIDAGNGVRGQKRDEHNRMQKFMFKPANYGTVRWRTDNHPQDYYYVCDGRLAHGSYCGESDKYFEWVVIPVEEKYVHVGDWKPSVGFLMHIDSVGGKLFRMKLFNVGAKNFLQHNLHVGTSEDVWELECVGACLTSGQVAGIALSTSMAIIPQIPKVVKTLSAMDWTTRIPDAEYPDYSF